jgi:hypothetical protein
MNERRPYRVLVIVECVLGLVLALGVAARVDAAAWEEFGRCLTNKGAIFYGASWCPHCRAQQLTLGDAMSHVHYVECADDGKSTCKKAGVNSYPTWVFGDGSRALGEQSLAHLAAKTGCALPGGRTNTAVPTDPAAARPRSVGPKVIEVQD